MLPKLRIVDQGSHLPVQPQTVSFPVFRFARRPAGTDVHGLADPGAGSTTSPYARAYALAQRLAARRQTPYGSCRR